MLKMGPSWKGEEGMAVAEVAVVGGIRGREAGLAWAEGGGGGGKGA